MNERSGGKIRILIGLAIAIFSIISYFASRQYNPITGEDQYISITPAQEIALGAQSAPQMIQEFGGLDPNEKLQQQIDAIGFRLVEQSVARNTDWQFEFTVLNDPQTVNAFALPGGQVFITEGLLSKLDTEEEVAGVLAHEIVHVLARHSAQQIAQNDLTNGLVGAVAVASGDANAAQTAAVIAQLINMRYSREDESQSDTLGVCLMLEAEYDPNAMIGVMQVLAQQGGSSQPEFLSTHPNPENRIQAIQEAIQNASADCPS